MTTPLGGARIVVTRPAGRGETLCARIAALGGEAFSFPVIDIAPLPPPRLPDGRPDWLIFASVAAVEYGLAAVRAHVSPTTRIAAIGAATASALHAAGFDDVTVPARQESEGLLELPALLDVAGQHVWIVRGGEGRTLLADALRERGANVSAIDVYERRLPQGGADSLLARWREHRVDAVVVTSRASLENLHALLDAEGRRFLGETQLVMPTERMLKLAHELDIRPAPRVAANASDDALLAALVNWWRDRRQDPR